MDIWLDELKSISIDTINLLTSYMENLQVFL